MAIRKTSQGWIVEAESSGRHLGGPYQTRGEAEARLAEVEFFKHRDEVNKRFREKMDKAGDR